MVYSHETFPIPILCKAMITLAGAVASFACTSAASPQDSGQIPAPTVRQEVLEPGRLYSLAIPANYTGNEPIPLILALHYGGHGSPYFGFGVLEQLVDPALRELGAIVVAPDCTSDSWADPRSEQDVLALLDHVNANYNIDRDRTLITGYSMGGIGTWHLAARHPDRFRAAIIMSGYPPDGIPDADWSVPLYVIHTQDDPVVPIAPTEAAVEELRDRGFPVEFVVLPGNNHYDTSPFIAPLRAAIPWIEEAWGR